MHADIGTGPSYTYITIEHTYIRTFSVRCPQDSRAIWYVESLFSILTITEQCAHEEVNQASTRKTERKKERKKEWRIEITRNTNSHNSCMPTST